MTTKMKAKAGRLLQAEELLRQAGVGLEVVTVPALRPEVTPKPPFSPPVPFRDPGPPPINTLFGIGRPSVPPSSRKDGKRRSGDYLLGAQRIKTEVAARPADSLNGSDTRFAEGWTETALQLVPEEMAQVGTGGELIPVGEEGGALVLRNTLEHPTYVNADAGRDRLELASKAGVLELALDTVETIQATNSLEKMLAHQLAAAHRSSMAMTAQLNRCIENMDNPYNPDAEERANIQGTRLAGAIARTNATFQSGMLALQKMRSGGQQTVRVVHQHVTVSDGAQAVVAGEMTTAQPTGGRARGRRERSRK